MELTTSSEKENPYMKRKELVVDVAHSAAATPSNAAIQQAIAKDLGVAPEQVDIKGIYSLVGRQASKARIFVWQEKKVADLSKAPESAPKEEAKPAEAPKEEKKEEKPAEAPKEEKKEEPKKEEAPKAEEKPAEEKKE